MKWVIGICGLIFAYFLIKGLIKYYTNLNNNKMSTSNYLSLNGRDFFNGLIMAVLPPVIVIIEQSIANRSLTFDWGLIGLTALGGALGYLTKNFFTGKRKI